MFAKTELWIVHPGGAVRDDLFDSTVVLPQYVPYRYFYFTVGRTQAHTPQNQGRMGAMGRHAYGGICPF